MLGLAEGRPLSSQKTIGKPDRLLGSVDTQDSASKATYALFSLIDLADTVLIDQMDSDEIGFNDGITVRLTLKVERGLTSSDLPA